MYLVYFQRLKDLRTDKDLTQQQIADILFMKQQQYSRYENGEREIPMQSLIILANFYDVSIDYIVGRTNNKKMNK